MRRAPLVTVVLALAVLVGLPASAFATWGPTGAGSGQTSATNVGLPTSRTAAGTGATSIHITWSAPSAPSAAPTQYVVRRVSPTSATVCTVGASTFACDDTGLGVNTTYTYTIEARLGSSWSSGQSPSFSATTSAPTFNVVAPAGTRTAGVPFSVQLTATTNGATTDASYTGVHTITFSGPGTSPGGTAPTYPATVSFTAGVGSATITLVAAQTVTLQATDGTRIGTTSVTVAAAAASTLRYTSESSSCASGQVVVGNGGTYSAKVSTFDAFGNTVVAAASLSVNISKSPAATGTLSPTSLTIPASASETSASFTFKLPVGNPPDVTVTAAAGGLTSANCLVRKN